MQSVSVKYMGYISIWLMSHIFHINHVRWNIANIIHSFVICSRLVFVTLDCADSGMRDHASDGLLGREVQNYQKKVVLCITGNEPMGLPAKGCYECKSSRRDWASTWKRDLQGIIKQVKLMRFRKTCSAEKSQKLRYCVWGNVVNVHSFLNLQWIWLMALLEAGTGLGRAFVWTKYTLI